jgi:hypothetical protein
MDDLEPGKTYWIRVLAVNEKGLSPPSEPAKVTTFAADTNVKIDLLHGYSSHQLNEMTIVGTSHRVVLDIY